MKKTSEKNFETMTKEEKKEKERENLPVDMKLALVYLSQLQCGFWLIK